VNEILAHKERWVRTQKAPENARERHLAITAANHALQPYLSEMLFELERQCDAAVQRMRASAILESREYAFCLYPRRHFEMLLLDGPPLVP
jgi:hypothetical protein